MRTPVRIKSSHLVLDASFVKNIFGDPDRVAITYRPKEKHILVAPATHRWFVRMHQPAQQLLKQANRRGDRSVPIHGILIDHRLDAADRAISGEFIPATGLLKIAMQ